MTPLNGKRRAVSNALPSSSVRAVVVIVMSKPLNLSILSYSISGKIICSVTPMAKFPLPSNDFGLKPRKSLIRGIAIFTSLSRNSYIRSPRKVTLQPMGHPSLILKPAILLRAFVTTTFCPLINSRSLVAFSNIFLSATASPSPIFKTTLVIFGTRIVLPKPSSCDSCGTIFS